MKQTIEIINNHIEQIRISIDFEIQLGQLKNGKIIEINKFINERDNEIDNDWEFLDVKSQKIFNQLSEDQQEEVREFIDEIQVSDYIKLCQK